MRQTSRDLVFSEDEYGLFLKKDEEQLRFYTGYYMSDNDMVYLISKGRSYKTAELEDVFKEPARDIYRAKNSSVIQKKSDKEAFYYALFCKDKCFGKFKFLFDKKEQKPCCTLSLLCKNEMRINASYQDFKNKQVEENNV